MSTIRRSLLFSSFLTLLLMWSASAVALGLSAVITSTTALCYDNGSMTVTPSGGTGPYTLTLLSGPTDPNITYPVTLSAGLTTFSGLPAGSYSIQVTDASGNTTTVTGTVPGSYQFPSLSFNIVNGNIIASGSGGRAPFSYSISSTGSNSGFGPSQSSDTFSHICPGLYWIRVTDSCGNIYTDEVDYADTINANISCDNFSKGTLNVTASGGTAPYTYTIGSMTNTTGNFSGLPSYFSDSLVITDACGVRFVEYITPPMLDLVEHCPFDSVIYLSGLNFPFSPDMFTFICTNCVPPQTVTLPYNSPIGPDALFAHQPPGLNYNIVILSSACGGDTIQHPPISISSDIEIGTTYLSCRSVQVTVTGGSVPIIVDSFVLSYVAYGPTIEWNTTGLFENLPDSTYLVTAYIGNLCNDTPRAPITIPYFGSGCYTLMKDASCQNTWEYSTNSILPERYSLIISGNSVASIPGPNANANFYGLTPGTSYTLVSDSGCTEILTTPPASAPVISVVSYLPCVGQPVIQFNGSAFTYCSNSNVTLGSEVLVKVFYGDSLIYDFDTYTSSPIIANITQSGWYHYTIYTVNSGDTSSALKYDTICPIDTGSVFMDNTQVPYLYSSVGLVCDTATVIDSILYHVYGGSAPYTVEIPGYDTTTLTTNTGVFPTHQPGTYTMIVYDNCGISRSMTFAVVDTCSGCPYAVITLPDTASCAGDTVQLVSTSIQGKTYQWYVNGQLYSLSKDTFLISGAGGNTISLIVISSTGCADTAYAHTTDTCNGCPYPSISMPDTLYCVGDTVTLTSGSIGGISYLWSVNGQAYSSAMDTIYIVTAQGDDAITLSVTSATACTRSETISINVLAPYVINLGPDTTYCGAFNRQLSTGISSTVWSTGQTAAQIIVDTPGTYTADASNRCGNTSASIVLTEKPIPVVSLGNDTTLCQGGLVILNAGDPGDTYIWSDSSKGQTLSVSESGTYVVTVTQNGCSASSGVIVTFLHIPVPFSLGKDTTICSIYPLLLEAYQPDAYYLWNTGSTQAFMYVDQSGEYVVTDSNKCGKATDSINVTVDYCTCIVQIPTAFSPNHDGHNDTYGAIAPCIPLDFLLEIYDRWGQKLFTSNYINTRWDGTYHGHDQPLGVYVYVMKYTDPYTNKSYTQSGNVTLVR
jgi:gliding motility-associated-like protein